jgi:hypothetical protein
VNPVAGQPGAQERLRHQIVGPGLVAGQKERESKDHRGGKVTNAVSL